MENFKDGDKVYVALFQSETGVIEHYDPDKRECVVRLDSDNTLVTVSCINISLVKQES